jgi:hypothetical protein
LRHLRRNCGRGAIPCRRDHRSAYRDCPAPPAGRRHSVRGDRRAGGPARVAGRAEFHTVAGSRAWRGGPHKWFWKSREVRERAWIFLAHASDDPRFDESGTPEIREADGSCYRTVWRSFNRRCHVLPVVCPATLPDVLRAALGEDAQTALLQWKFRSKSNPIS